ncbi:hypothetical protein AMES_7715 [Amycolatopsis mediterranei S699]|uniref:Uncharacterized protein n=2 Tax=Amycolatopsis mediterranei TaxID=33910 RepID=A0A0H3DIP0_AMYMU|nr:hypothetical protein [Amycolatopsis mediterranei]ADJ49539.1 hypothetical protein AMED_7831 [Amycolatopsis mediterranei U32]AEK46517.1 hypothetical protein RAM_40250 [Amycolatopsis mediterranei S699]AFO81248.1 hypothetical protein AMES_7715 [Amycolatopsis mediterranei S699]AGT88376.1 hypothetical protein B737_7715 [Amycolatopsis mediterranei RB]KDO04936.1 hypothetical protein DV26_41315 [Amycolatopsis mediterranei]
MLAAAVAVIVVHQTSAPPAGQDPAAPLPDGPVLTVGTDPVDSREFLLQMGTNRAEVFQYFYDHYGVRDTAGFWTTPHGETTPLAMLKQRTTQQLVRLTVQLQLARARNLVEDITYGALVAGMPEENQRRTAAVAQHRPVYGLTSFTEETYFNHVTTNLAVELKQSTEQGMKPPPTAVLHQLYEQLREQNFSCPPPGRQQHGESSAKSQYCADGQQYLPFVAVEPQVVQRWKDDQFESLIAANIRAAHVEINHMVFDKIEAQ